VGEIRLEIPARPEYLALVRQVVAAAAGVEPRFRAERIDALRIAVSEAATNAVESHLDLATDERVVIRCDLDDERIEVEVLDQGGGFDPDHVPVVPDVTDPERLDFERGLGIPIMRQLTDEADILATGGGTTVRLVVYRSAAAAAALRSADEPEPGPDPAEGDPLEG
jgi:serine/threonine-protein kinase RsbW